MQPKIILDVDPGVDDAVAVVAALKSKNIDIIGISVVSGNVEAKRGILNASTYWL